jgi:hypothetical protein
MRVRVESFHLARRGPRVHVHFGTHRWGHFAPRRPRARFRPGYSVVAAGGFACATGSSSVKVAPVPGPSL